MKENAGRPSGHGTAPVAAGIGPKPRIRGGAPDVQHADSDRLSACPHPTHGARLDLGGLALVWYAISTFGPLELPGFAVVFVLGVLVMLSLEPDVGSPTRGVTRTRRNLILALPTVVAFVPVAGGMNLLLGRIPIEAGHAVLATLAAVCVALPRLAETRELPRPAVLGHREAPDAQAFIVGAFWVCMAAAAVLVAFPPRRICATANVLAVLGCCTGT